MPLFRRIPKRGFNNANFATRYVIVNVSQVECFEEGASVDPQKLSDVGLIDSARDRVKILGDGELNRRLSVVAHKFSRSAEQKITSAGGTVELVQKKSKRKKQWMCHGRLDRAKGNTKRKTTSK